MDTDQKLNRLHNMLLKLNRQIEQLTEYVLTIPGGRFEDKIAAICAQDSDVEEDSSHYCAGGCNLCPKLRALGIHFPKPRQA